MKEIKKGFSSTRDANFKLEFKLTNINLTIHSETTLLIKTLFRTKTSENVQQT